MCQGWDGGVEGLEGEGLCHTVLLLQDDKGGNQVGRLASKVYRQTGKLEAGIVR